MLERGPVRGNAGSAARRQLRGEEAVGHTVGTMTETLKFFTAPAVQVMKEM